MVLNICDLSRGVVCDQGEVELMGGAKYTLFSFSDHRTFTSVYACPSLVNQPVFLHVHVHA